MSSQSQYGDTILLAGLQAPYTAEKLARVQFTKGPEAASYDEAWLQNLIMLQPGLLPVGQIEPVFLNMVPICTELPMRAGFVDNLFVTPAGDLALVECKLWRNPEARCEVVAQIIDYATEISTWTYETLQDAGFHFTLGFVAIALFKAPGGYIAQPRVLARTTNIERGIVTLDEGHMI